MKFFVGLISWICLASLVSGATMGVVPGEKSNTLIRKESVEQNSNIPKPVRKVTAVKDKITLDTIYDKLSAKVEDVVQEVLDDIFACFDKMFGKLNSDEDEDEESVNVDAKKQVTRVHKTDSNENIAAGGKRGDNNNVLPVAIAAQTDQKEEVKPSVDENKTNF